MRRAPGGTRAVPLLLVLLAIAAGGGCGDGRIVADGMDAREGADAREGGEEGAPVEQPDGWDLDQAADPFDAAREEGGGEPAGDGEEEEPAGEEGVLYAAPDGTGEECLRARPCSLGTARDKVRTMSGSMTRDIAVRLFGGRYDLAETFELSGELDSGRGGFWISYEALSGETPVPGGGVRVAGWAVVDAGRRLYRAPAPAGLATRHLFVDGVRARRARGATNPAGFTETATGYRAPDASMASWRNPSDIEVVSLRYWKCFRCSVASIAGAAIAMDEPCWTAAQPHAGFDMGLPTWIENAYELVDVPGEWYHDRAEGFIYYIPRPGEDLATADVVAARLETLVRGAGTAAAPLHHVRFEGITLRGCACPTTCASAGRRRGTGSPTTSTSARRAPTPSSS